MIHAVRALLGLGVLFLMLIEGTRAQTVNNPETPEALLERARQRPFQRSVIGPLMKLKDPRAITALREAFDRPEDKETRQTLAQTLIWLGEKDSRYLDFLVEHAQRAIRVRMPSPFVYGPDGMTVRGQVSPEFQAWCRAQGRAQPDCNGEAVVTLPQDVFYLAISCDPRAAATLLEGLRSTNGFIVFTSARGLACAEVTSAIPVMAEVGRTFPGREMVQSLGRILTEYKSPEAARLIAASNLDPDMRRKYEQVRAEEKPRAR